MKGPTRPAPTIPGLGVSRYSPVTNWDTDPFGAEVFEPPHFTQKKKPPPRPPPPKIGKHPEVPVKPSHFIRRPTVLSSLLSRKSKTPANQNVNINQVTFPPEFYNDLDSNKMFPKCEPKIIQTGALIDLSSPPSSPTFTTRSSSDGLSVDSFGSDATTSTNHHNNHGGNASQGESGFEDDFDLFLNARKTVNRDDTMDDFTTIDPFSPQPTVNKPPLMKKPVLSKDLYELSSTFTSHLNQPATMPTIIRAKPARPKPPDNSALLKNTFGGAFPVTNMTVNTTTPIQKISNGFGDNFESKPISWDEDEEEREPSPPMPTIPPPPPPVDADEDLACSWPTDAPDFTTDLGAADDDEEPYAIALFDYFTDHPEDLSFSANSKIKLIRRVDHEWLYGATRNGIQGLFPSNYVEIKVPLPNESASPPLHIGTAIALYDFEAVQPGDLNFVTGDTIQVRYKINDEWYFGECNNNQGQFPVNYVQIK